MSHTSMVTEHRFASPQTNVTKQGNRILILDEEQAGNFAADQSELTDFDSVRRMLSAPLRWHSGFPAVPTFRMRLPCVTKQNNQGRTIRHDCIPLPTKSATASNPNRRGRLYEQRARLQSRQQHQRQTHHRQTASAIAKSAGTVVVETLNVAGMVRNRRLAKALTDAAVGGFLRELEWQCVKRGVRLLKAGLWFPRTQICVRCGGRPNARIDLSVRLYRCHLCGWQCDRDRNAALNLKQVAPALWATIKGGGGDVSPAPGPATPSEASIGPGNHWQPALLPG